MNKYLAFVFLIPTIFLANLASSQNDIVKDDNILKLETKYGHETTLLGLPVYVSIVLTNISANDVTFVSPMHRLGFAVSFDVSKIDDKNNAKSISLKDQEANAGDIAVGPLYDKILLKPGESIKKPLHILAKYPNGFEPGKYRLMVRYGVKGYYEEQYPDCWKGEILSESEFIVKKPEKEEINCYSLYKDINKLNIQDTFSEDFKSAPAKFNKLIKRYPKSEYALYSRYLSARSYYLQHNYDEAINLLESLMPSIADAPYLSYAQETLLGAYRKTRDFEKARAILKVIDLGNRFRENILKSLRKDESSKINQNTAFQTETKKKEEKDIETTVNSKSREIVAFLITFPEAEKKKGPVEYKVKTNDGDFILFKGELMDVGEILWVKLDYPNNEFLEKHKQENTVKKIIKLTDTEGRVLIATIIWQKEKNKEASFGEPFVEIMPEKDPGDAKIVTYSLPTEDGKKVNIEIEFLIRR